MPAKAYIGDENGIAQAVSKLYIGDENGIAQRVVKAYIGDENGIAQLCYSNNVRVTISGLSSGISCKIKGNTYSSGDVTLQVEIGTLIEIKFGSGNTQVYINTSGENVSDALQNCDTFKYVVNGECNIVCSSTAGAFVNTLKAIIAEDVPTSSCFRMYTEWNDGDVTRDGFSFRNGMTWATFVGSMYNVGNFVVYGGEVSWTHGTVINPDDDTLTGGFPVKPSDRIYRQTYL